MKYKYEFKYTGANKDHLSMYILDPHASYFSGFLWQLTNEDRKNEFLEIYFDILNGKYTDNMHCYEVFCVEIHKDKTYLYSNPTLPGQEDDYSEENYIETSAIPELVEIWWAKYKEHYKK